MAGSTGAFPMVKVVSIRSRRGVPGPRAGLRRHSLALLMAALPLSVLSCGEAEASVDPRRVETLLLEPAEGFEATRPDAARVLEIPSDPGDWLRSGSASWVEPTEPGETGVLRIAAGRETRFRIPVAAGPGELDGLGIRLVARSSCELSVRALGPGEFDEPVEFRRVVHKDASPQDLSVEWPALSASPRRIEVLELRVLFARQPVDLIEMRVLDRTLDGWLPRIEDGEDWIEFDGDARRGVGLRRGRPLMAEFAVLAGARLRFEIGAHPSGEAAEGSELLVEISDGLRDPEVRRVRLPATREGERRRWKAVNIPLDPWVGLEVEVRFRVEGAGLVALANARLAPSIEAPPTVLLVTSDTHRLDHLGFSEGGVTIETPFLDALAAEGTRFSGFHATTNVTLPSHATILTGLSPRDHGAIDNRTGLGEGARSLAEAFRDAGFSTYGLIAAAHLRNEHSGLGQGFDRFSTVHNGELAVGTSIERLLEWLPENQDRPLFIWLHAYDAHAPYEPPEYFRPKVLGANPFDPDRPALGMPAPLGMAGLRDGDWANRCYRGEVEALDDELGALLEHPRIEDAIVAFTADHGECLEHPQVGWGHPAIFPGILRVPMVLRYPGGERDRVRDGLFDHTGVGRTLLDVAGLEETPFPGRSLLRSEAVADRAVFALSSAGFEASIRRGDELLVLSLEGKRQAADPRPSPGRHAHVLYDLSSDPEGTVDVSKERPERASELRVELIDWLSDAKPRGWARAEAADAETLAELEAMGYLESTVEEPPNSVSEGRGGAPRPWIDPECACPACGDARALLPR